MAAQNLGLVIDVVSILIYTITFYQLLNLTKKLYGGRFTSLIPPLSVGIYLLLIKSILVFITRLLFPAFSQLSSFLLGIQTLTIIAGLFFLTAFYQLYQISFATTGFFGGRD